MIAGEQVKAFKILLTAAVLAASAAQAQQYPIKPVRIISPFAPGGGTDVVARALAAKLTETWRQPVVVDNRPGAETIIGTDLAAKAPPDGYTMLVGSASLSTNPSLFKKLPYDTARDFAPITLNVREPYLFLVHPSLPVHTVKELIAYSKANPKGLSYGAGGSQNHLAMEWFKLDTGANMVYVPYRGVSVAITDLVGGRLECMFITPVAGGVHVRAGKVRAIAVTGSKRSPSLPDVPTVAEAAIPGFDASAWNGVVVPAAVPQAIQAKLNRDIVAALHTPETRERLAAVGLEPIGTTPEEFAAFIRKETATWARVVKAAGLQR